MLACQRAIIAQLARSNGASGIFSFSYLSVPFGLQACRRRLGLSQKGIEMRLFIILVFLAGSVNSGLWALEAGAARMEITPRAGLPMMGFGGRIAEGMLDPLNVRAVVFRSTAGSVALVVYDLLFPFEQEIGRKISERIRERTGVEQVIFSATHTHSGPQIHWDTPLAEGKDLNDLPDFEQEIVARTIETVALATSRLQPVRLGTGWGTADVSYDRRERLAAGGVNMKWANHQRVPMKPVDQALGVIRVDDLNGQPLVILVNYACHPVIHGKPGANLMYSADFPGVLCRKVSERLPRGPECIFFNGACGNINPYYAHSVEDPKPRLEEVGGVLADQVVRVASAIDTKEYPEARLQSRIQEYPSKGRWNSRKLSVGTDDPLKAEERAARIEERQKRLDLPVSLVLLTPAIGFVGLPGEFFWEFQDQLRANAPVEFLFVTGYTNESHGYFPTIEAAAAGGYGANDEAVFTAAGAGEHLVIEALVGLNEMLGRIRDVPSSAEFDYKQ